MQSENIGISDDTATGKKRGRPHKDTDKMESVNLTLPPSLIRDLQREQKAQGLDSLSAAARVGLGDWVRRCAKRTDRAQ